jgi:hypothetical protein
VCPRSHLHFERLEFDIRLDRHFFDRPAAEYFISPLAECEYLSIDRRGTIAESAQDPANDLLLVPLRYCAVRIDNDN